MPRTTPPKVLAFMASVVTVVVFAVATVALFTQTRANYTWALFLGVPFAMAALPSATSPGSPGFRCSQPARAC